MEIHKTSETLEQQILEDARRKASRTLDAADKDARAIAAEWEVKGREEAARIAAEAEARCKAIAREMESALPLDFMRTRLAATEEAVRGSLAELFARMPGAEVVRVLGTLLGRSAWAFAGRSVSVHARGLDAQAARGLVAGALPGASIDEVREEPSDGGSGGEVRGVIVESRDGRVRSRATLAELEGLLLEERREEMARALLGSVETR